MNDRLERSSTWRWTVCGLMLLATMLMYMDRQTLSQTASSILKEANLNEGHLGSLEQWFGYAFAFGAIFFGIVGDWIGARWLYPFVLVSWSVAGVATAYAQQIGAAIAGVFANSNRGDSILAPADESGQMFLGLWCCRVALGFFEAGQWPCALITSQRILSRENRTLGNSILQSGASLGAVLTPLICMLMVTEQPGSWRGPFQIIGLTGMLWAIPWRLVVRPHDLDLPENDGAKAITTSNLYDLNLNYYARYAALIIVVVSINLTWHFFRAWMPLYLEKVQGFSKTKVQVFSSAYYITTDIACLLAGIATRMLVAWKFTVHSSRMTVFATCVGLTALSLAANSSSGFMVMALLLLIGAGSIGQFPNYYAFTQELTKRHQGKVTGTLGFITWMVTGSMQGAVGKSIKETGSYELGFTVAGLAPMVGLVALLLLWNIGATKHDEEQPAT